MFYPNRRDLLITLGALAAGVAIGEPAPYLHGMTASTTSEPNTGEIDEPMITTKDGTQIFYKDWGPKNAQPIVFTTVGPVFGRLGGPDAVLPRQRLSSCCA